MNRIHKLTFLCCAISVCAMHSAAAVGIQLAPVGNPGNANDTTGFGSVSTSYNIGIYEVTNIEYAEFLNAKAASDPLALYNTNMGSSPNGGILRAGTSGSFTYSTKPDMGAKPVTYVSFYDALRFANWLSNNQGAGSTETGSYTLNGGTAVPTNGATVTRNAGTKWFLPSENQWYKAAYHQPVGQGGDVSNYWDYATSTNSPPASAQPAGTGAPSPANSGNFFADDLIANSFNNGYASTGSSTLDPALTYVTYVHEYDQADSFYRTFDQGGNVAEWTEAISGTSRIVRGGSWAQTSVPLLATTRSATINTLENDALGFRIAHVPEPSTFVLAACGLIGCAIAYRKQHAAK